MVDRYISELPETGTLASGVIRDAARKRLERINYFLRLKAGDMYGTEAVGGAIRMEPRGEILRVQIAA